MEAAVPAFMSPKWGGVVLLNPSCEECSKGQYVVPVNMLMGTFISQLRKLLGITDKVASILCILYKYHKSRILYMCIIILLYVLL